MRPDDLQPASRQLAVTAAVVSVGSRGDPRTALTLLKREARPGGGSHRPDALWGHSVRPMGGVEDNASGIQRLGRNQEAYDKFSQAVEVPLLVLTILWLPVLIVPLVHPVHGSMAETFAVIDYMVWALFALEYVIKLYLAPSRWKFVRTHILDLLIVAGRAIGRGKSVMTHRGLHFVLLTVGIIVLACAAVVRPLVPGTDH